MTEVTTVYDRFTALAKRVMVAARDAAASLGHDFIGTEHLLIGLAQTAGTAGEVLRAQGVELDRLRAEVERQLATRGIAATHGAAFGAGSFQFPRPAFSLSAKHAVKASLEQAREVGQERIDTEHLLLGVLAGESDAAIQVLAALGIDVAALRRTVASRMTQADANG